MPVASLLEIHVYIHGSVRADGVTSIILLPCSAPRCLRRVMRRRTIAAWQMTLLCRRSNSEERRYASHLVVVERMARALFLLLLAT